MGKDMIVRYLQEVVMAFQRKLFYQKRAEHTKRLIDWYKRGGNLQTQETGFKFTAEMIPAIIFGVLWCTMGIGMMTCGGVFAFISLLMMLFGIVVISFVCKEMSKGKQEQELKKIRKQAEENYADEIQTAKKQLEFYERREAETKELLDSYLKQDILLPKYQNLPAAIELLSYLCHGDCDSLNGQDGAYAMYRMEHQDKMDELSLTESYDSVRALGPNLSEESICGGESVVSSNLLRQNEMLDNLHGTNYDDYEPDDVLYELFEIEKEQKKRLDKYESIDFSMEDELTLARM